VDIATAKPAAKTKLLIGLLLYRHTSVLKRDKLAATR
jgi:hypothetical protein